MQSPFETMNVMVTGAAGFIGSHLAQHLLDLGYKVIGVDNFCDNYHPDVKRRNINALSTRPDFMLAVEDIRDRRAIMDLLAVHRPSTIFHLGAMVGVRPSIHQAAEYVSVNVEGTANILDGAAAFKCKKVIFASSSSVYGQKSPLPFSEDSVVEEPLSPYAATKRAAELLCHSYWQIHALPVFCVRLFTVYGPRQRPDMAISGFLRCASHNKPITLYGEDGNSRDYTYVTDIVAGMIAAMRNCNRFRIYNLGSNQPVSLKELIATIETVTGHRFKTLRHATAAGDVSHTWADLRRSEIELGYHPVTSLIDGITQQWSVMAAKSAT